MHFFGRVIMVPVTLSGKFFFFNVTTLFLFILLTSSCMVPLETDEPLVPFQVTVAGSTTDTISPFGPLYVAFTRPVDTLDTVNFIFFNPDFTEYQVLWNGPHDTAELYFAVPLDGNAHYSVGLSGKVVSTDGETLSPSKDTLRFVTNYCEQEPNDSRDLADLLQGTIVGNISTANDTDWFLSSDTTKRSFYLKSTGSSSIFTVVDNNGLSITPGAYADAETLSVPMEFVSPLYIFVNAYNYSNGGSYELGWVKGK